MSSSPVSMDQDDAHHAYRREAHALVLVLGATGAQGGAVIEALLNQGQHVRAITRDPGNLQAQALSRRNVDVVCADLDDEATLSAAMSGVTGVFSMQNPGPNESVHSQVVVDAARKAGVRQLVHTSVSGTGMYGMMPSLQASRWNKGYWEGKWNAEQAALNSGLPWVTILKPAFMMENFLPPKVNSMFPDLAEGKLLTAVELHTHIPLIAATDIGAFAADAFADPERYAGKHLNLAGDRLTLAEIAQIISRVTGSAVAAHTLARDELIGRGQSEGWVDMQLWFNEVGYPASPEALKEYGVPLLSFSAWALANRARFMTG